MKVPYRHVSIHWLDAQSSCDWKELDEVEQQKLALCISTGYLVHEDEEALTLVSDFASTNRIDIDSIGNSITIPKSCIVKRVDNDLIIDNSDKNNMAN
jgi:hypothetical protein